jgi:hypothetical protein
MTACSVLCIGSIYNNAIDGACRYVFKSDKKPYMDRAGRRTGSESEEEMGDMHGQCSAGTYVRVRVESDKN